MPTPKKVKNLTFQNELPQTEEYSSYTIWALNSETRCFVVRSNVTRLGDLLSLGKFLKPLATINLPKSLTFLCNFSKVVKIYHFSSEIIFGLLLLTFGDFSGHTGEELQV